jgi:carbamoylphosphate synthase large subunit
MRILVTGLGGPAGSNVVKYLPSGSVIAACDANPSKRTELERVGRPEVRFYTVPHASNADAFKMAINQIVIRQNIDTVIPTVDEELMVLSYRPEHIDAMVVVSPYRTTRTCNDKALLYDAMKDQPFCPRFVVADNKQDLASFGTSQVFKKPRIGRGSKGVM